MRSALALGGRAIITTHRNAPEESGALARAAAGALERVPMIRVVNLARAIERPLDGARQIHHTDHRNAFQRACCRPCQRA